MADHVAGVQYPKATYISRRIPTRPPGHPMPSLMRIGIAQLSVVAIIASTLLLMFGLFLGYVLVKVMLGLA